MPRWRPSQDIRPITAFRANASAMLDQVKATGRPLILTQHGRGAAVLLDVAVYEDLLDEIALLRDVNAAEAQVAKGRTTKHATVAKRLRAKLLE